MNTEGILFDALQATPDSAGIGRYAFELARELARIRPDVRIVAQQCMAGRFDTKESLLLQPDLPRSSRRILFEQLRLPHLAGPGAWIHYPDTAGPLLRRRRFIITVHDLSYICCPNTFTAAQATWKRLAAAWSARHAACVVCSSEHTAGDVRDCLGVPADKVRVIYPGVSVFDGEAQALPLPPDKGPFVLAVGTLEPRKNFVRLIQAVAEVNAAGMPLRLVIAGKRGWKYDAITEAPARYGVAGRVTFAGYCTDAQLRDLYRRAALLAYVSLYEGFGLPTLEAMALGLPVVASRVSCIPEVCGDAARYVDPLSVDDIALGIRQVADDDALRRRLIEAGHARVRQFSWRRTAEAVSALYGEMMQP